MPNVLNKSSFSANFLYGLLSIIFILLSLSIQYVGEHSASIALLLFATLSITMFASRDNIFHISLLSGHYAFWVMPILVTSFAGLEISYFISFWCICGLFYAVFATRSCKNLSWGDSYVSISNFVYVVIYLFAFLALFATGDTLSFIGLIGILVVAAALRMSGSSKLAATAICASLLFYTAVYYVLFWGGYGRLIVIGVFMNVAFIYLMRMGFSFLLKPIIVLFIPFGTIIGTLIRFRGDSIGDAISSSTSDSAITPILLSTDIFDSRGYLGVIDFDGWVDQVILFFFPVVPRVIWPSKPNGFGYQYTLENLDPYLASAGHSVAANFLGEHIYYLGGVGGVLGAFFALNLIVLLYRFLSNPKIFGGYCSFIVALWLPTYYWGGMQAFSSRFMLSFVPLAAIIYFYRIYVRYRIKKGMKSVMGNYRYNKRFEENFKRAAVDHRIARNRRPSREDPR